MNSPVGVVSRRVIPVVAVLLLAACGGPEARKAQALEEGRTFLEAGNLEKARIEMRNVLQIDPNDVEARYLSGVIAEELNNMRQAAGHFAAALDIDASHGPSRAKLATIHVMAGLPGEAVRIIEEGLETSEEKAPLLAVRGAAYAQLGRVDEAMTDARVALEEDPANEQAIALLAGTLSSRDLNDEAIAVLDDGIELLPASIDLRLARATVAEKVGALDDARQQYITVLAAAPDTAIYRLQFAAFHQRNGDDAAAEALLRESIDIDPSTESVRRLVGFLQSTYGRERAEEELKARADDDPAMRLMLADFYGGGQQFDQARESYQEILDTAAASPEAQTAMARLAALEIQEGNTDAGAALIDKVLGQNPRAAEALLVRAELALTDRRPDDAIVDLRMLVRDDPEVISYHTGLARAYLQKGQTTLAEEALRDAVRAEPNNLEGRIELSRFLARNGKPDVADDLIRSVIIRQPDNLAARDTAVRIAITRGDWQAALDRATAITEIAPEAASGYYLSGTAQDGLGNRTLARASYLQALDLDPTHAESLTAFSRIAVPAGDVGEVFERLDAVPADAPNRTVIDHLRAEVLISQERPSEAREILEAAIAERPDWWMLYRTLSRTLPPENTVERATILEQGFAATGAPVALGLELATLQESMGRYEAAISTYEKMIEMNASSDLLFNNLAMLLATHRTDAASLDRAQQMTQQFQATDNPAFLNTFGWTRLKGGQVDAALPALRQAVNLQPNSAILRYHLGVALMESGDMTEARAELARALEIGDQFQGAEDARTRLAAVSSS